MTPPVDDITDRTRRDIERFLDDWRVEKDIPGLSVALVDNDGLLHSAGLGARDVETRMPATPDTRYLAGSVTKWFTASAVLQLVERGALALDDEIREYVDYWTAVPGEPITVAEVLSHSSGVPRDYAADRGFLFSDETPTAPLVTLDDLQRHVNDAGDTRIVDEDRLMYSNRGYKILGELVAAVDGRPYAEVVETELLDPLGMDRATIGHGSLTELDDTITPYTVEEGTAEPSDFDLDADRLGPASAGGLLCSVRELAQFVRCMLNGGEREETRILDEDLVTAMCTLQNPGLDTIDDDTWGTGYGPQLDTFLDEAVVWHTGTLPGRARAYAGFLPERGLGVTLGTNTGDVPIGALGKGVLAIAAGEDPESVVPYLALRRKTRAVAGTYEGFRGGMTMSVEPAETTAGIEVTYGDGSGATFTAFPESTAREDYTFSVVRETGVRRLLSFNDAADGMELWFGSNRLYRTGRGRGQVR